MPDDHPFVQPPDDCPFCEEPMKVIREIAGMPVVMGCDCEESRIWMEGFTEELPPFIEDDDEDEVDDFIQDHVLYIGDI